MTEPKDKQKKKKPKKPKKELTEDEVLEELTQQQLEDAYVLLYD